LDDKPSASMIPDCRSAIGSEHQHGIEHGIAHPMHALRDVFRRKIAYGRIRGAEQQGCAVVRQHAVVLLRHAAVEGAQAGLDMGNGDVQFAGRQRAGQGRIRIAIDQQKIRLFGQQQFLHFDQHFGSLAAM
jgi:hypothetical protein